MRAVMKDDVPMLALGVLAEEACHGYAIARRIEQRSEHALSMKEGTLYPALRALEGEGWIEGEWEVQPSGPARRVYRITAAGRGELERRRRKWLDYVRMMERMVGGTGDGQPA